MFAEIFLPYPCLQIQENSSCKALMQSSFCRTWNRNEYNIARACRSKWFLWLNFFFWKKRNSVEKIPTDSLTLWNGEEKSFQRRKYFSLERDRCWWLRLFFGAKYGTSRFCKNVSINSLERLIVTLTLKKSLLVRIFFHWLVK